MAPATALLAGLMSFAPETVGILPRPPTRRSHRRSPYSREKYAIRYELTPVSRIDPATLDTGHLPPLLRRGFPGFAGANIFARACKRSMIFWGRRLARIVLQGWMAGVRDVSAFCLVRGNNGASRNTRAAFLIAGLGSAAPRLSSGSLMSSKPRIDWSSRAARSKTAQPATRTRTDYRRPFQAAPPCSPAKT
jgi:hypothetical protein